MIGENVMIDAVMRCPDCDKVLLIIGDPTDPSLPSEIATKVDAHICS